MSGRLTAAQFSASPGVADWRVLWGDIYLPHDQVQARIDAALAVGGRIVSDAHAPLSWTLADPEGNEVDLAIWG
jgi:hypothetical protein